MITIFLFFSSSEIKNTNKVHQSQKNHIVKLLPGSSEYNPDGSEHLSEIYLSLFCQNLEFSIRGILDVSINRNRILKE